MAWPSIPVDLILTDRVRIRHWLAWTADSVGGRVPSYSSYGASTPCAIEAKTAADLMTQNTEHPLVQYDVTFAVNPWVNVRDQLSWDAAGKILTVVGIKPIGDSTGQTWTILAEEHSASGQSS